jgi:hypothetical protein
MTSLIVAFALALAAQAPATEAPTGVARMKTEALALGAWVQTPLATQFLSAVPCLPTIEPRTVYYNKQLRDAFTPAQIAGKTKEALDGYEETDIPEQFFYYTRYGTPLAFVRPLDILGGAGVKSADGLKIVDFGFGSIGQLRVLASLGASATGIEVDPLLKAIYSQPGDTGRIARCAAAGKGHDGDVSLVFGQFPADAATTAAVGKGYDVFVSKNTLKHGYIHPDREVDPRMLVHLDVDDATFVQAMFALLKPGGVALIYNLCPAPSKEGEPYKPWSDGRSPFTREVYERAGFTVAAFDVDDTEAARTMGKTLGWADQMDLENDLFGTYTLLRKPM